jgi:hypothetical protein
VKSQSWEMRDAEFVAAVAPNVLATVKGMVKALLKI